MWPQLGVAAGVGLCFASSARLCPIRVGDVKGVSPAVLMLMIAAGAHVLRILTS
jgi:hypothetical protein